MKAVEAKKFVRTFGRSAILNEIVMYYFDLKLATNNECSSRCDRVGNF